MNEKVVFVTVGTTKFDLLVSTITKPEILQALKKKGFKNIIIQYGKGHIIPDEKNATEENMKLSYYTFKHSLKEDMAKADLIISHGGAGTCLEVLEEKKPLLVVINEELMDNHQTELADKLSCEGYLFACTCDTLLDAINSMDITSLKTFPPGRPKLLADYLDEYMGFQK